MLLSSAVVYLLVAALLRLGLVDWGCCGMGGRGLCCEGGGVWSWCLRVGGVETHGRPHVCVDLWMVNMLMVNAAVNT